MSLAAAPKSAPPSVGRRAPADRVAVIGFGAIGRRLVAALRRELADTDRLSVLVRRADASVREAIAPCTVHERLDQLIAWKPTLVVESATQEAVKACVPQLLGAGIDVILVSVGALADPTLRREVEAASQVGGGRLEWVSGALGGLDTLRSARGAGLERVEYIGRKPPAAWMGSVAEKRYPLASLTAPTTIFRGSAGEAATLFPKNANVAATIALEGAGFNATEVELIADPLVRHNVHTVRARGPFGTLLVEIECVPLPDNPRTSLLAALSAEAAVRRRVGKAILTD